MSPCVTTPYFSVKSAADADTPDIASPAIKSAVAQLWRRFILVLPSCCAAGSLFGRAFEICTVRFVLKLSATAGTLSIERAAFNPPA